ncbi:MAG: DoxX family protein [Chloroflexi bacterium]|nr:MAG: DoxX family protein [Chloroflexota bacterium]
MSFFAQLHQFSDFALLILRLALGTVFIVHGTHKRGLWKMQPSAQMPAGLLTKLRILSIVEPAGGLGVLFGFLTQLAALGLVIVMLGAIQFLITKVHRKFTGDNSAGWEFEFMLLIVALALAILGGGKYALDRAVFGL